MLVTCHKILFYNYMTSEILEFNYFIGTLLIILVYFHILSGNDIAGGDS
jgi:hypothetical protein